MCVCVCLGVCGRKDFILMQTAPPIVLNDSWCAQCTIFLFAGFENNIQQFIIFFLISILIRLTCFAAA